MYRKNKVHSIKHKIFIFIGVVEGDEHSLSMQEKHLNKLGIYKSYPRTILQDKDLTA